MTMMTEEKEGTTKEDRVACFSNHFNSNPISSKILNNCIESYLENAEGLTELQNRDIGSVKYVASFSKQFKLLYGRSIKKCIRQKKFLVIRYAIQIFFALLCLALYFNVLLYFIYSLLM